MTAYQIIAKHYLIAALWADAPDGTKPRITKQASAKAMHIANEFFESLSIEAIKGIHAAHESGYGAHPDCGDVMPWFAACGHDLWLTSQGYGTGFWDRDELPKVLRDYLTEKAKAFDGVYPEFYRGWMYLHGGV